MKTLFDKFLPLKLALITTLGFCCTSSATAQSTSVRSQIAELSQRFVELEQNYNLLKLQVENLTSENNRLKQDLAEMQKEAAAATSEKAVEAKLSSHRKDTEEYVKDQYQKMLQLISSKIEGATTPEISTEPSATTTSQATLTIPTFTDDFPKNGTVYTVQTGDTLGKIAKKFGSTVKYIQNANKISNPNAIQVGQKLFVPFEKR